MKYLRSKAKQLSVLALFTLALQLGLSFAHFHNDLHSHLARAPVSAAANHAEVSSTSDPGHAVDHDLCAICVTMAMANAIVDAVAPKLPQPLAYAAADVVPLSEADVPQGRRGFFQSRAPPQA